MARYNIYMKNSTYAFLLGYCAKKELSMGKLINIILDKFVEHCHSGEIDYQALAEDIKKQEETAKLKDIKV